MRIRVDTDLDCSADAAWAAAHRPAVAARLYAPLLRMVPLDGAPPERFTSGDRVRVSLRLLGAIPVGSQLIAVDDLVPAAPGRRTMRDSGCPLSGPLALLRTWNHEMTVIDAPDGRARWGDELRIGGAFAVPMAPVLWVMWRWRVARLRRLARGWDDELRRDGTEP
ncbi:hypothetical protein ACLD0U_12715 [Microbacterium sp. 2216-1]|uniref:hypothetical protein n=1 Tax=Microbacterium TaxID=33882 RepID=UPI003975BBCE